MVNGTEQSKITEEIYRRIGLEEKIKSVLSDIISNRSGTIPDGFNDEPFNRFSILSSLTFLSDPDIIFAVARMVSDDILNKVSSLETSLDQIDSYIRIISEQSEVIAETGYSRVITEYISSVSDKVSDIDETIASIQSSVSYGVGVPEESIKNLISQVKEIIWPALVDYKYSGYYDAVEESYRIEADVSRISSTSREINKRKENLINLLPNYKKNKQNYLIQVNVINHLSTTIHQIKNGIEQGGLSIPRLFNQWTKDSLADISILASTVESQETNKKYSVPYNSSTSILRNIEDLDTETLSGLVDNIKVSGKYPYVEKVYKEYKSQIYQEIKKYRDILSQIKNAISFIIAPRCIALEKLFSILKYHGLQRPVDLLKEGDIETYFNLNSTTITYEGYLSDKLQSLIGDTSSPTIKSFLTEMYYQARRKDRELMMMVR